MTSEENFDRATERGPRSMYKYLKGGVKRMGQALVGGAEQ